MMFAALALLVMLSTASVDYAHARYVRAVMGRRAYAAARWSVAQWVAGAAGFVLVVRYSMWLLPFEALGLALGTYVGVAGIARTRAPRAEVHDDA